MDDIQKPVKSSETKQKFLRAVRVRMRKNTSSRIQTLKGKIKPPVSQVQDKTRTQVSQSGHNSEHVNDLNCQENTVIKMRLAYSMSKIYIQCCKSSNLTIENSGDVPLLENFETSGQFLKNYIDKFVLNEDMQDRRGINTNSNNGGNSNETSRKLISCYRCYICGRPFITQHRLNLHMDKHSGSFLYTQKKKGTKTVPLGALFDCP